MNETARTWLYLWLVFFLPFLLSFLLFLFTIQAILLYDVARLGSVEKLKLGISDQEIERDAECGTNAVDYQMKGEAGLRDMMTGFVIFGPHTPPRVEIYGSSAVAHLTRGTGHGGSAKWVYATTGTRTEEEVR